MPYIIKREEHRSTKTERTYIMRQKRYGFFNFFVDVTLTCLTAGLWLIWIFVREMRGR